MNLAQFWQLIEQSKQGLNTRQQEESLVDALSQYPVSEILDFNHWYQEVMRRAYTTHLWAAAHLVFGGCSDDCFDYFLGWLIAQGEQTFSQVLESPDNLLTPIKAYTQAHYLPYAEGMFHVAARAYEKQTRLEDFWDLFVQKFVKETPLPEIELDWKDS